MGRGPRENAFVEYGEDLPAGDQLESVELERGIAPESLLGPGAQAPQPG